MDDSDNNNNEDVNLLERSSEHLYNLSEIYKMAFHAKLKTETYFCFSLQAGSILLFLIHWLVSISVLLYVMYLSIHSSFDVQYLFAMILYSIYVMVVTAGFYGVMNGNPGFTMLYFVFFLAMTLFYFILSLNTFAIIGQIHLIFVLLWFTIVLITLWIVWRVYVLIEKTEIEMFVSGTVIPV